MVDIIIVFQSFDTSRVVKYREMETIELEKEGAMDISPLSGVCQHPQTGIPICNGAGVRVGLPR